MSTRSTNSKNEIAMDKLGQPPPYSLPGVPVHLEPLLRKKCKRCAHYYTEATNGTCNFHPGMFVDPETTDITQGAITGWSCCRVEERVTIPKVMAAMAYMPGVEEVVSLSEKSQHRECVGCQVAAKHEEDPTYTEQVSNFPVDVGALEKQYATKDPPPAYDDGGKTPGDPLDTTHLGYHTHVISPTDTLSGISLRYNVSTALLKRANQLWSDSMAHLDHLKVPLQNTFNEAGKVRTAQEKEAAHAHKQKLTLQKFMSSTGLAKEEALFYLEEHPTLDAAVQAATEDLEWEKQAKK